MKTPFANRAEAGRLLAERLVALKLPTPRVVLALPRGGVPIAAIVARALHAPLDLLLVRKIGLPWQPELALAAVVDGERPEIVVDEAVQAYSDVEPDYIEKQAIVELREIARRRALYLRGRAAVPVAGCTAIVVDDGIATGTTVRAALKALRRRNPARLVLAVPVAPSDTLAELRNEVDQIVCLAEPYPFEAIGLHYRDFHQVPDDEVLAALDAAAAPDSPP
jgi:putative phosphoribosyl transferase